MHEGNLQNWGVLGSAHFLKRRSLLRMNKLPPHMCHHVKFGRSALLNGVGINTGEPQIWKRWNYALLGWEAWLTPRYMPFPTCVTTSNVVRS